MRPLSSRVEDPAESFPPTDLTDRWFWNAVDELVSEALMGSFQVIVLDVLRDGLSEVPVPPENPVLLVVHRLALSG